MLLHRTKITMNGDFNSVPLLDQVLSGTNCIEGLKVRIGLRLTQGPLGTDSTLIQAKK